jgi:hypothetical protein
MRLITLVGSALLLSACRLDAQSAPPAQPAAAPEITNEWLRAVMGLPRRTDEARRAGVPDSTVRSVLDIFRSRGTAPETVEEILIIETDVVREGGPRENFGAFVQAQLQQGLRGRALSDAIRAEHARQGRGPGARGGRPDDARPRGGPPAGSPAASKRGGPPADSAAASKRRGPPAPGSKRPLTN